MRIWDRGTYETHKFDDEKVEVTFHGERLRGRYGLFPLKRRKGEPPGKDWMIHRMDPAEDPTREPMPPRITPMLAKPSKELPPYYEDWAIYQWTRARDRYPNRGGSASRAATQRLSHSIGSEALPG